jgi:hypothetical protein
MPTFRINHRQRGEQTVEAARVVTDGRQVCFENRVNGRWDSALTVPCRT